MTAVSSVSSLPIDKLRAGLTGRVILPGDPDYDRARTVMRADVDKRPALIVRPADADDVAQAIAFARAHDLEIAVRSGGHSSAGQSVNDNGLVIDLRDMTKLEVDPEARTLWAETGLDAAAVTKAAWEHGMVIGFGDTGTVGIGGITLGGGIGYMVRKFGLTIDNLLAAEVVTADGSLVYTDAESEPQLFWGIRGGGGNFGVATRFKYLLHPVEAFVGGMLILPATADTVAGFMKAAAEAPEEVSAIANVMNCPPFPFVPEEVVSQLVIFALIGHAGDEQAGIQNMKPFQSLAKAHADLLKPMPYPEMYGPEDPDYRPLALDHIFFMDHIDRDVAQTMIDRLDASNAPLRAVQLRALGGAMARVPHEATAFPFRDRKIMVAAVNFYEGEADYEQRARWLDDTVAALDQGVPGTYVNFVRGTDEAAARSAYPEPHWSALAHIKSLYDPHNVFRGNQNIPPSG
jgi:FAD/FMN-containing dehydrogenase